MIEIGQGTYLCLDGRQPVHCLRRMMGVVEHQKVVVEVSFARSLRAASDKQESALS